MASKKYTVSARDLEFILGNSFHRLMVEVAREKKSRRKMANTLEELAHFFFSHAVYRQTGQSVNKVKFNRPWTYEKAVAWLAHYAREVAILMDDEGIAPLLMEQTLAPYPLCKDQGLFVETRPDLIARRVATGDLAIFDYKTTSVRNYLVYQAALGQDDLAETLNKVDQLVSYGAAAENDVHEVNEKVDEVGLIVAPRTPLSEGDPPLPLLFLTAPFDRKKVKPWHIRQLEKRLRAIAEEKSND